MKGAGGLLRAVFLRLSSTGLACVLLIVLLLLTWRGTLAQVDFGLHAARERYFGSFVFWQPVLGVSLPLPGAQLVLWVLAANLVCGGVLRVRWSRANLGVLIAHLGILLLLAAGFVEYYHATRGVLELFEGEEAAEFQSQERWEIVIGERLADGRWREHLVPDADFVELEAGAEAVFRSADLPFDLAVTRFLLNARPRPAPPGDPAQAAAIDGFVLEELAAEKEVEMNCAGARVEAREKGTGAVRAGLLWGGLEDRPLVLALGGGTFAVDLRRERVPLGWSLRLERFTKTDHPGIDMARDYRSLVTVRDGGLERAVEISMNEPLRHQGFILYQSRWGPQSGPPERRLYSVLAVSRNPSDQWPLYACVVIALGLLIHYARKLLRYGLAQSGRSA